MSDVRATSSPDPSQPVGKPAKPRRLQKALAGLPELELFESDEALNAALEEIRRDADRTNGWQLWIQLIIAMLLLLAVGILVNWLWPRTPLVRELPESAQIAARMVVYGVGFLYLARTMLRRSAPAKLRERLLASGVPVCRGCGYSLKGLSLEMSLACPECGRAFDPDVRSILRGSG